LALSGGNPAASSAGNEISDPPPATALTTPAASPAATRRTTSPALNWFDRLPCGNDHERRHGRLLLHGQLRRPPAADEYARNWRHPSEPHVVIA
jgi:hypothetical protein